MDLEKMKKNISNRHKDHMHFVNKALVAERYYHCKTDILFKKRPEEDPENPRNSSHRIPNRFYKMLVDQKASYMFDKPPYFDLGSEQKNQKVQDTLGKEFGKECKKLSVDASNCGYGVLHYWVTGTDLGGEDEENPGEFKYGHVDPKEIIPIWGSHLNRELLAVMRHYEYTDMDGDKWDTYEWWDNEFCYAYKKKLKDTLKHLRPFNRFWYYNTDINDWDKTNVYKHGFDKVPFIILKNDADATCDLEGVKERLDAYDEVNSQFANDLEDFQQVIFVLSGYGREPSEDFLERMKRHKLVKLESGYPDGIEPKLDTLAVEIPIEANQLSMELNRKGIFEQGGGVDQTPDVLNYTSGEALKYRYALLELKASATEDEFRNGFTLLVKAICKHLKIDVEDKDIEQRWQRTKVNNDTELMNNARLCLGFTSLRTALKVNPYVEDVDEELKYIEQEREEEMKRNEQMWGMSYSNSSYSYGNGYYRRGWGNRNYSQSSNERVLNQHESENKSHTVEKYQVGKAVKSDK